MAAGENFRAAGRPTPDASSPASSASGHSGGTNHRPAADMTVVLRRSLPGVPPGCRWLRIVHVSDTHDKAYTLPEGDVLVHSGDMTDAATPEELQRFQDFLAAQPHRYKLLVCGSHESGLDRMKPAEVASRLGGSSQSCNVLHDASVMVDGVKFYGTPWNNSTKAFGMSPEACEIKFQLIPSDTDVLITHQPPFGVLDLSYPPSGYQPPDPSQGTCSDCGLAAHPAGRHWGSKPLRARVDALQVPVHLFGRSHHSAGVTTVGRTCFSNGAMEVKGRPTIIDIAIQNSSPPPAATIAAPLPAGVMGGYGLAPPPFMACVPPPMVPVAGFSPSTSVAAMPGAVRPFNAAPGGVWTNDQQRPVAASMAAGSQQLCHGASPHGMPPMMAHAAAAAFTAPAQGIYMQQQQQQQQQQHYHPNGGVAATPQRQQAPSYPSPSESAGGNDDRSKRHTPGSSASGQPPHLASPYGTTSAHQGASSGPTSYGAPVFSPPSAYFPTLPGQQQPQQPQPPLQHHQQQQHQHQQHHYSQAAAGGGAFFAPMYGGQQQQQQQQYQQQQQQQQQQAYAAAQHQHHMMLQQQHALAMMPAAAAYR